VEATDLSQDGKILQGLDAAVDDLSDLLGSCFGERVGRVDRWERGDLLEEVEDCHALSQSDHLTSSVGELKNWNLRQRVKLTKLGR
jgi:hypothetical protein